MTAPAKNGTARNKALDLLARREHSARELRDKLKIRGFANESIDGAISKLEAEGLLSDERFAESWLNYRRNAGIGPLKIRHELLQKGIDVELADRLMAEVDTDWDELLAEQRVRRFGAAIPADYRERMKQARFLQNKGFSPEAVMRLFR